MRLAVDVTTCTTARSGIGYYTEHLVDALLATARPGDDVVLLSNRAPAPELAERWAPHLFVEPARIRALWMQFAVPRLLAVTGTDVGVFPNYLLPFGSACPSIVVLHDASALRLPAFATRSKALLMRPLLHQVAATAGAIGTVSEASRRDLEELLGVPPRRLAILPGAAHPSCRPATSEQVAAVRAAHRLAKPYLLTVGTLEPRKDLLTLLRAYDRLRRDGETRELVVVGGRGWRDGAIVQAIEARRGRGVRWLGYVPENDLAALYSGADLVVLSPVLEGFGLPLLEAMAAGASTVAADIPALREVGGDAPRFVPPGDDAAFAQAISLELADVPGRAARGARGVLRARHFTWTRPAETLWARARAVGPIRARSTVTFRRSRDERPPTLPAPLHPTPPSLSREEWALLAAVDYADLFESPLPIDHAVAAAMGVSLDVDTVRRLAAGPALAPLVTVHPKGYLVLAGRDALADSMPDRHTLTRALLGKYDRRLRLLKDLPFIRGLVLSGGVPHKNVGVKDDIDLFVVAARGRAYTAYTALVAATIATGTRGVICPNYVVDETELAVAYHRDLFTAHQLVSARPYSGSRAYEALCAANEDWVRAIFPTFRAKPAADALEAGGGQRVAEVALAPFGDALEASLRWAWRVKLWRRAARAIHADMVLGDGMLKLHLSDYRARVLARFTGRLDARREEFATGLREGGVVPSGDVAEA